MPVLKVLPLCLLLSPSCFAANVREVEWSDLSRLRGRAVEIIRPDGTELRGKVARTEPAALVLRVPNSGTATGYADGEVRVPRESLGALRVFSRSRHWRVIGGIAGFFGGAAAAVGIVVASGIFNDSAARDVGVFSAWGACTAGGYLLGNAADKEEITLLVIRKADSTAVR